MPLSAGTRLGPYEIMARIGAGGMGEVYKARDPRLDRIVAIKISQEKFSQRFEREARAVAALNHPNICTLHDVGTDYLVMEYIEGAPIKGPLPLDRALKYAVQICDALDAAHQKGITHRDLKPAQLTWFDRSGRESGTLGNPQGFSGDLRVSPDGKKLAATILDFSTGGGDIWVYDLSQGTAERVTFGSSSGAPVSGGPVWSPDNTRIAFFIATALAAPQLRVKAVGDRASGEQFPSGPFQLPSDWSSDDRWIFFTTSAGVGNGEIWVASVKDRKIMPLLQTPFDSASPTLSWDREYLAFSANDTGRYEIYVQRFQGGDSPKLVADRRRVSHNGGNLPRWRRDGKELFFLSPDRQIVAVSVQPGIETDFGPPAALFRLPTDPSAAGIGGYEVSHDGQKFLAAIRKGASPPLQVVVNWQAGLKE